MARHRPTQELIERRREGKRKKLVLPDTKPSWIKRVWVQCLLVLTLISMIPCFYSLLPRLSLQISGSVRSRDPMGTEFTISNDGLFSLQDVTGVCLVDHIGTGGSGKIENITLGSSQAHADVLSAGHQMGIPCSEALDATVADSAKIRMEIRYRQRYAFWHSKEVFPLEAQKTDENKWLWRRLPN